MQVYAQTYKAERGEGKKTRSLSVFSKEPCLHVPRAKQIEALDIDTDADHAGFLRIRKSTSGGRVVPGGNLFESWASIGQTIPLSPGEDELRGVVMDAAAGLRKCPCCRFAGQHVAVARTGSTASLGTCK